MSREAWLRRDQAMGHSGLLPTVTSIILQDYAYSLLLLYASYNSIALRQRLAEDVNFRWCLNVKCDHGQIHRYGGLYHFAFVCQESFDKY